MLSTPSPPIDRAFTDTKKRKTSFLAACLMCQSACWVPLSHGNEIDQRASTPPPGYQLVWSDEFDGDQLDTDAWAYRTDNKHRSLQRKENVTVKDGRLVLSLKVLDPPSRGKHASGAGIITKRRYRYGYFEVRARLGIPGQDERGWHHSFWAMAAKVLPDGSVGTTYPGFRRTEIDCYENPTEHRHEPELNGLENFTQHIIVWKPDGKEAGRLPKPPTDVARMEDFDASEWHTYAYQWTPAQVRFYVDGKLNKIAEYPADKYEHDEVNLWLTAISALWNRGNQIPSRAEYDYLRCYELAE